MRQQKPHRKLVTVELRDQKDLESAMVAVDMEIMLNWYLRRIIASVNSDS